jgi:hypothetical protein
MHHPNGRRDWIDKINGAAIGHVDPESEAALICNQPIASGMFLVHGHRPIDNFDLIAVDLFSREQRPIAHAQRDPYLPVDSVKTLERLSFVVSDIDAGDALNKGVTTNASQVQG